jgi:hypothetical protein
MTFCIGEEQHTNLMRERIILPIETISFSATILLEVNISLIGSADNHTEARLM